LIYVARHREIMLETLLPADLLASTEKTKPYPTNQKYTKN